MTTSRQIFAELLSAEAGAEARLRFDPNAIRQRYFASQPKSRSHDPNVEIARLAVSATDHLVDIRSTFISLSNTVAQTENAPVLQSKVSLEVAPLFTATQYLLHAVCGNWNNEACYALTTLRIHAIDVGCGQPRASRIDRYQEMLRKYSIADIGADLLHTAVDTRISDGAFAFASKLMILSYLPESFAGEILGINLFLRQCGLLPPFELFRSDDGPALYFLDLGKSSDDGCGTPAELSIDAAMKYIAEGNEDRLSNVAAGFDWARQSTNELCNKVFEVLSRWLDPREAARQLVHRRRHGASQYHETTKINGQMMLDLLAERDSTRFLDHLAQSNFVRPGDSARSPLLNGLISPQSKMFRIFSRDEIGILQRWIRGLPYETASIHPPAHELWEDDDETFPVNDFYQDNAVVDLRVKPRRMYERLLHTEVSSSDNTYAREYVERWLKRSAKGVFDGVCPLPNEWRAGELQTWLQDKHDASNNRPSGADWDIPSREDVVADVCSLAPLTMIDGAWLAGFSHPSLASSDAGYSLFETFFDELGNGIHELNHPVIYRDLMQHICGSLAPTHDSNYVEESFFDDGDFELPVFWLSIGKYPLTYRPEILGLNLAMELSGVGGGYRRTGKALAAYGFPTTFVNIHNSIDNISTGHSAWAATSIDAFMSLLPRSERNKSWLRIRTGFVALNPPARQMVEKIKDKLKSLL